MYNKEYITKALTRLKSNQDTYHKLYDLGVNLIDYESNQGLTSLIEESICMLLAKEDEKKFELILQDVQWWLYENVDKIIFLGETSVDVNTVENYVNWLFKHYEL